MKEVSKGMCEYQNVMMDKRKVECHDMIGKAILLEEKSCEDNSCNGNNELLKGVDRIYDPGISMSIDYDGGDDKGNGPCFGFDDVLLPGVRPKESGEDKLIHNGSKSKDKEERVSNNSNHENKVEKQKVNVNCKLGRKEMLRFKPDV